MPELPTAETIQVVACVIARRGRYLVCRRAATTRHGGLWEFPGGKLEAGEDLLAAATRELAEELGLAVEGGVELLFSTRDPGSLFIVDFVALDATGDPCCHEHQALAWVTPAELVAYELAPCDRCFAEALVECCARGGPTSSGAL